MKKRSHKNTTRLTARERAHRLRVNFFPDDDGVGEKAIEAELQAHARQALARERLRRRAQ